MTKIEKEKYMDKPVIGVYCLSNYGGLVILDIEYGIDDYVIAAFDYGRGKQSINRHKIQFTKHGRPYFKKYGSRYYFDDIMRVD